MKNKSKRGSYNLTLQERIVDQLSPMLFRSFAVAQDDKWAMDDKVLRDDEGAKDDDTYKDDEKMNFNNPVGTNKDGIALWAFADGAINLSKQLLVFDKENQISLCSSDRRLKALMKELKIATLMGFDVVTEDWLWEEYRKGKAHLFCIVGKELQLEVYFRMRDGKTVLQDSWMKDIRVLDVVVDSVKKAESYLFLTYVKILGFDSGN